MVLISCGQKNNSDSTSETTTLKLDTLIADNYILTFESADSFAKTDIYGDLNYRTKLTDTIHNWGKKAEKIQSYLLDKFDNHFNVTDSTLVLSLVDGTNKILSNNTNEGDDYKHYYFQHKFYSHSERNLSDRKKVLCCYFHYTLCHFVQGSRKFSHQLNLS